LIDRVTLTANISEPGDERFLVVGFHAKDPEWWDDLVNGEAAIRDGVFHLTDALGHGLTLNEHVAAQEQ